jgi:hypothetical protein
MTFFTPTASSEVFAGAGLSGIGWSMIFKIDTIAKLFRCERWVSRERILAWINANKVVTLLSTELFNFGIHGVESPSGVTFALGSTFVNTIMIFIVIPIRQLMHGRHSV